jgi:integrase/recombinase XerC
MFDQRLPDYLHYLKFERRYAANTLLAYEQDLLQFRDYLASDFSVSELDQITHFHIRGWLANMRTAKHTARTVNRKISSLNAYYKYLLKLGYVAKNPVRLLHAQRLPERLPVFLKETETDYLLNEIQFEPSFKGLTDRLICEILYNTGIRRNELAQLKTTDIEWSLKQIRILGKGNKERLIPVNEVLLDAIRDYLTEKQKLDACDTIYLLVLPSGEQLYPKYIYRTVVQYLGQSTTLKKKSPHVLRHTFATHLLNNGANIQAIKDLLGHSSLAATQIYTHNNIDKLKQIHQQNHPRG